MAVVDTYDIQSAIYALLTGSTVFTGRVRGGMHDERPQNVKNFPYCCFGPSIDDDIGTQDSDGVEHSLTIEIHSEYAGNKDIKQIAAVIRQLLHRQTITVDGLSSCHAYVDRSTSSLENDAQTRYGEVIVRFNSRI